MAGVPVPARQPVSFPPLVCGCAGRCRPRLPGPAPAWRSSQDGITVVVPGGVRVRYVLAGRMDQVGPGLRAADLDRAPAELGVKAPGIQVLLADTEVA